jgi:hypothetical protein
LILALCLSHFWASAPAGILESSDTGWFKRLKG